ncbi:MAG: hypothetical protein ACD_26C00124G0002 [uncultured bacterium]|nr:MAG: hypothetical protein ACD_26C00124G0002 [uncultured bacterium]
MTSQGKFKTRVLIAVMNRYIKEFFKKNIVFLFSKISAKMKYKNIKIPNITVKYRLVNTDIVKLIDKPSEYNNLRELLLFLIR